MGGGVQTYLGRKTGRVTEIAKVCEKIMKFWLYFESITAKPINCMWPSIRIGKWREELIWWNLLTDYLNEKWWSHSRQELHVMGARTLTSCDFILLRIISVKCPAIACKSNLSVMIYRILASFSDTDVVNRQQVLLKINY